MHNTMLTSSNTHMVDSVLRNINGETGFPVHVHQLDTNHLDKYPPTLPYKPDSKVILTFPIMEMQSLLLLLSQMEVLSSQVPFNPHASFIFVVTRCFENINIILNSANYNLWYNFKISNWVFIYPRRDLQVCDVNEDMYGLVDTRNIDIYFKGI
jgi:hypothetical protein